MAILSPVECMVCQVKRGFSRTLGCAEMEEIARHVLVDLCRMNSWDAWLDKGRYDIVLAGHALWTHSHWVGLDSMPCSFDRYVDFHGSAPGRFRVNPAFIEAMGFMCQGEA